MKLSGRLTIGDLIENIFFKKKIQGEFLSMMIK